MTKQTGLNFKHIAMIALLGTAAATPAFASSGASLDFVALFMKADYVVKSVMIILALFSLISWAIIVEKALKFATLNKRADRFQSRLERGRPLEEVASSIGAEAGESMPRLLLSVTQAWSELKSKPFAPGQADLVLAQTDRELSSTIALEADEAEKGLSLLSVIATSSPFIGLFGTVWGIMNAFSAIATAGDTNLATVAPAISEALFATAIGLGAAIPAYIAYNLFTARVSSYVSRLEGFADELMVLMTRRLSSRAN